jgi:predicted outer membrane repeat protein
VQAWETRFVDNRAGFGGAILSLNITSTVVLSQSIFQQNVATVSGGAIYAQGSTTILRGTFEQNRAEGGLGGAIYNESGILDVSDSTVRANLAASTGGGIATGASRGDAVTTITASRILSNTGGANGGGLANAAGAAHTATLSVHNSLIQSNTVPYLLPDGGAGGGIANLLSTSAQTATARLHIVDSTIAGNSSLSGGGIANVHAVLSTASTVSVRLESSTVRDNIAAGSGSAVGNGGGILNSNGVAEIVNSTISGNQANGSGGSTSGLGGGIANHELGLNTTMTVVNATIAGNSALVSGGGLANIRTTAAATLNLVNTIIAFNKANTPGTSGCVNQSGQLISHGHNLESGATCGLNQSGDLPNTDPQLQPLAHNGGPTETHRILINGPAAEKGNAVVCADPNLTGSVDQRGVARPQGLGCDIGAFEADPFRLYLMRIHQK